LPIVTDKSSTLNKWKQLLKQWEKELDRLKNDPDNQNKNQSHQAKIEKAEKQIEIIKDRIKTIENLSDWTLPKEKTAYQPRLVAKFIVRANKKAFLHLYDAISKREVAKFPAFSGDKSSYNNKRDQNVLGQGPIPANKYYIVNVPSGGLVTWARSTVRSLWFALYAIDDDPFDDKTPVEGVSRGWFRLHPGTYSFGCVTIYQESQLINEEAYSTIISHLKTQIPMVIPGTNARTYGIMEIIYQ
jgi:hypothetical protein